MSISVLYNATERLCSEIKNHEVLNRGTLEYLHARYSWLMGNINRDYVSPRNATILALIKKNLNFIEYFLHKKRKKLNFSNEVTIARYGWLNGLRVRTTTCKRPSRESFHAPSEYTVYSDAQIYREIYDYLYIENHDDLLSKLEEIKELIDPFFLNPALTQLFLIYLRNTEPHNFPSPEEMVAARIKKLRDLIFFQDDNHVLGYCLWKNFCALYPILEDSRPIILDEIIKRLAKQHNLFSKEIKDGEIILFPAEPQLTRQ